MVYGLLLFMCQTGSRREANKKMSKPIFWSNIKAMFPEFDSMPHADTLARLLEKINKGNVTLIADGLYACGPVIKKCREYQWDYMIVLKEDAIPEKYGQ